MGPLSSFLSFSLCTPAAAAYGKSSKGAIAERYMTVEKEPQVGALAWGKAPAETMRKLPNDCEN
jgi:hypothetical protein